MKRLGLYESRETNHEYQDMWKTTRSRSAPCKEKSMHMITGSFLDSRVGSGVQN
jgi:hypothetical protein